MRPTDVPVKLVIFLGALPHTHAHTHTHTHTLIHTRTHTHIYTVTGTGKKWRLFENFNHVAHILH